MSELPLTTAHLSGTGGAIKSEPADFVVEELPLYEASGSGEHVYLRIEREGQATRDLVVALGRLFVSVRRSQVARARTRLIQARAKILTRPSRLWRAARRARRAA